jgi:hypothetical protein
MPTKLGTNDSYSLLDRFSRVLHLVEKARYTKGSRKRLGWMVHGLHGGRKLINSCLKLYSRWCTDMGTLYLGKIYDHDFKKLGDDIAQFISLAQIFWYTNSATY